MNPEEAQPNAYRPINRAQPISRRMRLRDSLPTVLSVAGGTFFVVCLLGLMLFLRSRPGDGAAANDIQGARIQTGMAIVVSKTPAYGRLGSTFTFRFRLGDQTVLFVGQNDLRSALTREGDTVAVTYKTGKSGTYTIQDWQPPHANEAGKKASR